jgi:hypothetical protein
MLHGVEKQRRMIDILHDVEGFDFYLTGSRYFGTESSDSDWDFFTTDSEVLRDWLRVCGFKRITAEESGIFNSPYLSNLLSDRLWKREIWRSFYRLFNVGML